MMKFMINSRTFKRKKRAMFSTNYSANIPWCYLPSMTSWQPCFFSNSFDAEFLWTIAPYKDRRSSAKCNAKQENFETTHEEVGKISTRFT